MSAAVTITGEDNHGIMTLLLAIVLGLAKPTVFRTSEVVCAYIVM
jgi:predicted amino acid-binding ACT domain protein